MSAPVELIVAAFKDLHKADQALKSLMKLEREGVIRLLNAAVLRKGGNGLVSIHETQDVHAGQGAIFGAFVGGLIGLLGGPAGVIVGAAAGAATGGVAADRIDMGFPDATLREIKQTLTPNSSVILALIEHERVDRVAAEMEEFGADFFKSALKTEIAEQLSRDGKGSS
ncbi:MAG: hypothetical protein A2Z16_09315 [Chloroflexi bacterium RBG_16_54_18]|nr:MAG: hypothetical protein A2Z16_09315 [Chloroflexi bacterium RBG_16_54_18]